MTTLLEENASLDDIRSFFSGDAFATQACGAVIMEAQRGYAVCSCAIEAIHLNAHGAVMGGALFTLADFSLAVASNIGEPPTVSVMNTIEFISPVKGTRLIATCETEKTGTSLGFYRVRVEDDRGILIATMTATCFRKA